MGNWTRHIINEILACAHTWHHTSRQVRTYLLRDKGIVSGVSPFTKAKEEEHATCVAPHDPGRNQQAEATFMYPPFHSILPSNDALSNSDPERVDAVTRKKNRAKKEKERKKKKDQGSSNSSPLEESHHCSSQGVSSEESDDSSAKDVPPSSREVEEHPKVICPNNQFFNQSMYYMTY